MSILSPREIQQLVSERDREIADLTRKCQQFKAENSKLRDALEIIKSYAFAPADQGVEAMTPAERLCAAGFVATAAMGEKQE